MVAIDSRLIIFHYAKFQYCSDLMVHSNNLKMYTNSNCNTSLFHFVTTTLLDSAQDGYMQYNIILFLNRSSQAFLRPLKWTHGWSSSLITVDKQREHSPRYSGISVFCHLITIPLQRETCLLLGASFCSRPSGNALAVVLKCSNRTMPLCCVLSSLWGTNTHCLKAP